MSQISQPLALPRPIDDKGRSVSKEPHSITIRERDEAGREQALYIAHGTNSFIDRVDTIWIRDEVPFARRALAIFLPTGYPASVSPDYTAYHIYNSLQAFSSTVAGLLASRAVLQGLGVGDENASATNAMLLNVLQESMGRLATILFAHRVGTAIEAECKMYRFLADVFNDAALVFDCLSPMLPKPVRVPMLAASSVFRALCGVAAGSSKATLSAHFARGGTIGELNAKDASQETVISLVGMWVGGVVVLYATSTSATWIWLLALLITHLSTNYLAVRSVTMPSINRQRANIIFSSLMATGHAPDPGQVAKEERLFENNSNLRWRGSRAIGTCEIGVSFSDLLCQIGKVHPKTQSVRDLRLNINEIISTFAEEQYLLWIDASRRRASILLCDGASVECQFRAWAHALRVMHELEAMQQTSLSDADVLQLLRSTLREQSRVLQGWINQLETAGWDVHTSALGAVRAKRICLDR